MHTSTSPICNRKCGWCENSIEKISRIITSCSEYPLNITFGRDIELSLKTSAIPYEEKDNFDEQTEAASNVERQFSKIRKRLDQYQKQQYRHKEKLRQQKSQIQNKKKPSIWLFLRNERFLDSGKPETIISNLTITQILNTRHLLPAANFSVAPD
ncbi:Hypothetical predicted protein [Octopus vulgaris]|uniref:Uncharacterized protein n=1 Tax=Octopus vulgaris TaxID=6645 RepID=A0AA36AK60_OCTVU|nr:Hypothetical predicted protein [Octopus vulgaris]